MEGLSSPIDLGPLNKPSPSPSAGNDNRISDHAASSQSNTLEETASRKNWQENNTSSYSDAMDETPSDRHRKGQHTAQEDSCKDDNDLDSATTCINQACPLHPKLACAAPESVRTCLEQHRPGMNMCPIPNCPWKIAYLKMRSITKRLMDEKQDDVMGYRWVVNKMEKELHINAESLDKLDKDWYECEPAAGDEEGREAILRASCCAVAHRIGPAPNDDDSGWDARGGILYKVEPPSHL